MASGDTLLLLHPYMNEPPSASYATADTRNQRPVLDFSDSGSEIAVFGMILPRNYAGGGITVDHHIAMSSGTTGSVILTGEFERVGTGQLDLDDDSFAAAGSVVIDVPPNSGSVTVGTINFTNGAQMDSIAIGEYFRYRITRRGEDETNDTGSGDLEFVSGEVRET